MKAGARNGVGVVTGMAAVRTSGILPVRGLVLIGVLAVLLVRSMCRVVSAGGRAERLVAIFRVWPDGRRCS
jgi:hypothetical protein